MRTAIYATLFHSISTDQKPQHFKCPTGKDSWCFFQAALARGEVPGPHVKHVKTPLKETHLAKIMPIYQKLASNELLKRCIRCVTQNANESLHSIIWGKCSKETSATLRRETIAVCDAVCEFNFGTKKSLENLQKENGLASNKQSKMLAVWRDYRRVYQRKRKRLAVHLPYLLATTNHRHASQQTEKFPIRYLPHGRPPNMVLRTTCNPDAHR
ncbi:uncharacterized protein TNCV_4805221 [Trichonephila clavipes]|nr:uncharacterized protein TNCV_4805221 [Trichonephila clavipes]